LNQANRGIQSASST